MKPKFTEEKKEAVLLLINAFKEDDGYAHINLECLSDNFIGQDATRKIIKELLLEGKLIDCTSQGFYRRYKIKNNQKCPEFLFNQHLSSTNKTFILRCINLKLDYHDQVNLFVMTNICNFFSTTIVVVLQNLSFTGSKSSTFVLLVYNYNPNFHLI